MEHSGGRVAQRGLRQAFHPRRPTRPPLFLGITSMGRFTVTYSSASPSGSMAAPISLNGFQARAGLLASGRANMPWYVTVTIAYRTTTAKPRFRQLSPRVAHHRTPKNGNARVRSASLRSEPQDCRDSPFAPLQRSRRDVWKTRHGTQSYGSI